MRKITLSLLFMIASLCSMADHWTSASPYDYPSSTLVYVQLTINGGIATKDSIVEIAAFVDDNCRAIAKTPVSALNSSSEYYFLRVLGNSEDIGKEIKFKVYHHGLEYAIDAYPTAVMFDTKTYIPVELYLDAVTGISLIPKYEFTQDFPIIQPVSWSYLYKDAEGEDQPIVSMSQLLSTLSCSWDTNESPVLSMANGNVVISGACENVPLTLTVTGPSYGDNKRYIARATTYITAHTPVSFRIPENLNIDRFGTQSFMLLSLEGNLDLAKLDIQVPSVGGVPVVATSTYQQNGATYFRVYGNMAGSASYSILYDGKKMKTLNGEEAGTINVSSSVDVPKGWSWMSMYSLDASDKCVSLKNGDTYKVVVTDYISEIRSQFNNLYNDPVYGMFGEITMLTPADGMYKINASDNVKFPTGTDISSVFDVHKSLHRGYNWFNNPYQLDLLLSQLDDALAFKPVKGDRIIGKDNFAEYDGTKWVSSEDFKLLAGKGYMYYSAVQSSTSLMFNDNITYVVSPEVNVNVLSSAPASARQRRVTCETEVSDWEYDASKYADNMAIVASIDVDDVENYSVGAFVGDECRGEGKLAESGQIFLNVAGQSGDRVSFKLLNRSTGEIADINETLGYSNGIGNLSAPLRLSADILPTTIASVEDCGEVLSVCDISGRTVTDMTSGIYLVTYNCNGAIVTRKVRK